MVNKEISEKQELVVEAFNKTKLFGASEGRDLEFIHLFRFNTEEYDLWENDKGKDHYHEKINIILGEEGITNLYSKDIDKLIEFVESIKKIRKKYEYVIKDKNFWKKKSAFKGS